MIGNYWNSSRPTKHLFILSGMLLLISGIAWLSGVRYNQTESYPLGFWVLSGGYQEGSKGVLVLYCPSDSEIFETARERGYLASGYHCESGIAPLLKKVIAVKGDKVSISGKGIFVNDSFIADSVPFKKDGLGRDLPSLAVEEVLSKNQVLLYSDYNSRSYDGRYFGVVNEDGIEGLIKPVFTWSDQNY